MEISRLQSQIDIQPSLQPQNTGRDASVESMPSRMSHKELILSLQANPYSTPHALELGRRLRREGKVDQSVQVLTSLCNVDNGFITLFELGLSQYQNEDLERALRTLQQAVLVSSEEDFELAELFKTLGNIFLRVGDIDSAEDAYYKALRLEPESAVLMVNLGTLEIQRGEWGRATEKFRQAIAIDFANDKAWVGLALCHRRCADFELAWANLDTAMSWDPTNETALLLASDWAHHDRKEAHLLEQLRQFLITGGWSPKLSLIFIWMSWAHGDRYAANVEMERILTTDPTFEAAWQLRDKMRASP